MIIDNNSYCLSVNLNNYRNLISHLSKHNIKEPCLFTGIDSGTHNYINQTLACTMGHLNIIYQAKYNKLPYCIIYEDDCYCVNEQCKEYLENSVNELSNRDWDVLFFGYCATYENHKAFSTIKPIPSYDYCLKGIKSVILDNLNYSYSVRRIKIAGSQSYIINGRSYNKILDIFNKIDKMPVDLMFFNNNLNCYITKKTLFIQHNIQTDRYYYPYYLLKEYDCGPMVIEKDFKKYE